MASPPLPSPQVVGNAFVEQYCHILHKSPESVYKFYQESSILSRPNSIGVMTSVTTTQGINDMILSLDYKDCIAEIVTVDSQPSYNDGVFILVTGRLTGKDKIQRKFTQSFFLAPQERGVYFVLNDMFRFVDDTQPKELHQILLNGSSDNASEAPQIPDPEVSHVEDHQLRDPASPPSEVVLENAGETCCAPENVDSVGKQKLSSANASAGPIVTQNTISKVTHSTEQEDAPKKSYASIVKVMKGSVSPSPVYVRTTKAKVARAHPEKPASGPEKLVAAAKTPAAAIEAPATDSASASGKNNSHDGVEGHSIYIRNLPVNATPEQVEKEFKKFGAIKPSGVQVRSHKAEPFCFGFVEFESVESMHEAIKASPITIAGRQVFVEEKITRTRVINGVVTNGNFNGGRGRYFPGRGGGFRNDNFRGGFGGNMGFVRNNDFRNRGEYSDRGDYSVRGRGQGYHQHQQRGFQNGYNGRMGRPNGTNQGSVSASA